jgi:hypothetical protein
MTEPKHFSEALRSLARVDETNRQAARAARATPTGIGEAKPTSPPPSVPLLDSDPSEPQRRREGAVLLDLMHASGIGGDRGWHSAGSLTERKP